MADYCAVLGRSNIVAFARHGFLEVNAQFRPWLPYRRLVSQHPARLADCDLIWFELAGRFAGAALLGCQAGGRFSHPSMPARVEGSPFGLRRDIVRAGMYSSSRKRPPWMQLRPCHEPDWRVTGATPREAADGLGRQVGQFGHRGRPADGGDGGQPSSALGNCRLFLEAPARAKPVLLSAPS